MKIGEIRQTNPAPKGCIIFDGSCGICTQFIGKQAQLFSKFGYSVKALQDPWIAQNYSSKQKEFETEIHLLLPDGSFVKGPDVYRSIAKSCWYLKPLYWLSVMPLMNQLWDVTYRTVAERRKLISSVCGLKPEVDQKNE